MPMCWIGFEKKIFTVSYSTSQSGSNFSLQKNGDIPQI
jgi:hypothetical protein